MTALQEAPFSDLINRPVDTVAKLSGSMSRSLRLRRRGSEDLVLTTASRAEQDSEVTSVATAILAALLGRRPDGTELLVEMAADVFPWVRFLPAEEVHAFVLEFIATVRAAEGIRNPAPIVQVIAEWRATAEVHADPELAAILRRGTEGDFGPVAEPSVGSD